MIGELFTMLVGGVLAAFFLRMLVRNRQFHRHAVNAAGVVVDRRSRPAARMTDDRGGRVYTLVVRFETREGDPVTTPIEFTGLVVPRRGKPVRVLYDPASPRTAQVDNLMGRGTCWQVPAMSAGAAVFVGGAVAFVRTLMG